MRNPVFFLAISLIICVSFAWKANDVKPPHPAHIQGTLYEIKRPPVDSPDTVLPVKTPMANTTLYITVKDVPRSKFMKTVTTDSAGRFSYWIIVNTVDTFQFYEEWKTRPYRAPRNTATEQWDADCYRTAYNTPDYQVPLKREETTSITIEITRNCKGLQNCCTLLTPAQPADPPKNRGGYQPGHQE